MREGIFFFAAELCDSFIEMGHEKNRVVAEAVGADLVLGNETFDFSLRSDKHFIGACKAKTANKSCGSFFRRDIIHQF